MSICSACSIEIDLGGQVFYGLTDNVVSRLASVGFSVMQEFRDNREFLT